MEIGTSKELERMKLILCLTGLWPNKWTGWKLRAYNFYSIFMVFFLFVYDLAFCIYIIFLKDINEVTYSLCMTLTVVALFGKVVNFKINVNGIQNLLSLVDKFQLESLNEAAFVTKKLSPFNKLLVTYFFLANMASVSSYVGAILSGKVRLPFLAWYPFDWETNNFIYVPLFLYQAFGMTIQSNLNVTMDLFSGYLMYIGSVKFEILGRRFENLNQVLDGKKKIVSMEALLKCVKTYQQIWKYEKREKTLTYFN